MISEARAVIDALLGRIDYVANRGALVMRAAAVFAWAGAAAATLAVFSLLGWAGWLIGAGCLLAGWILWRYGGKLADALDTERIRGQLSGVADLAKTRLGEVVSGIQDTRRRPIRGGFRVLRVVRGIRGDLDELGIDVAGIAEVSNPGSLAMAGLSLAAGAALWLAAAVGILMRVIL